MPHTQPIFLAEFLLEECLLRVRDPPVWSSYVDYWRVFILCHQKWVRHESASAHLPFVVPTSVPAPNPKEPVPLLAIPRENIHVCVLTTLCSWRLWKPGNFWNPFPVVQISTAVLKLTCAPRAAPTSFFCSVYPLSRTLKSSFRLAFVGLEDLWAHTCICMSVYQPSL